MARLSGQRSDAARPQPLFGTPGLPDCLAACLSGLRQAAASCGKLRQAAASRGMLASFSPSRVGPCCASEQRHGHELGRKALKVVGEDKERAWSGLGLGLRLGTGLGFGLGLGLGLGLAFGLVLGLGLGLGLEDDERAEHERGAAEGGPCASVQLGHLRRREQRSAATWWETQGCRRYA